MLGMNSGFLAGRQQFFSVAVMAKLSAHNYLGAQSGGLYSLVGSFPSRSFPKAFAEDCLPLVGKDKQPDVLWMPNQIGELPLQIQQARAMGITSTFLGGDSWDVTTLAETAGADMVEGACYVSCFSAESDSEAAKAWVEAFEEINGYTPGSHATLAYEALKIVINGLESIETFSREALRDAIAATNLELPSGTVTFDENRNPNKAAVIMQYQDGVGSYVTTIQP